MFELLRTCAIGRFCESLICNLETRLKYLSRNNWPCQAEQTLVDINSNETPFYPFTASVDQCGRSYIIEDPYAQICLPNNVKSMNVKVFNLIPGVNKKIFSV